jgi:hypothetical protein
MIGPGDVGCRLHAATAGMSAVRPFGAVVGDVEAASTERGYGQTY